MFAFSPCHLLLSLARVIPVCVAVLSSSADTGIVPCVSRRTGRVQPAPARRQEPLQGGQGHGGSLSAGPAPAVHGTAWGQRNRGKILPACIYLQARAPQGMSPLTQVAVSLGCSVIWVAVLVQVSHTHSHVHVLYSSCLADFPLQAEPHLPIIY